MRWFRRRQDDGRPEDSEEDAATAYEALATTLRATGDVGGAADALEEVEELRERAGRRSP